MSNIDVSLKNAMEIVGALGVSLVDYTSGMSLGSLGGAGLDLDVAAAGNSDVVRAKIRTMESLGIKGAIEDILITLETQFHIIRPMASHGGKGLFMYLVLSKGTANLAMARRQLANIEAELEV